jgi:hypothetical protein
MTLPTTDHSVAVSHEVDVLSLASKSDKGSATSCFQTHCASKYRCINWLFAAV